MLPAQWHVQDEMSAVNRRELFRRLRSLCRYNFESDSRSLGAVRVVVLSANELSYSDLSASGSLSCHVVPDAPSRPRPSSVRARNTTSDRCAERCVF
jgi:hypothetical protein